MIISRICLFGFCVSMGLTAFGGGAPDPVLKLTEQGGKPAVLWRGQTVAASEVKKATLSKDAPGGLSAVRLERNGRVVFPVKGEIGARGSLLVWVKPAYLPKAVGQAAYDMNVGRDGVYHKDTRAIPGRMQTIGFNARDYAALFVGGSHCQLPATSELRTHKNLFTNTWTCLAVTWGPHNDMFAQVDGVIIPAQHGWGCKQAKTLEQLILGQIHGWYEGFEGEIAGLKIWDKPLTREELRAEYAAAQPLATELRDFALSAGEKSRMRWRFFNYGKKDVKKDFSFALDGRTYSKSVSVAAGRSADLVFDDVLVAAPGVHRLDTSENRSFEVYAVDMKKKSVTDSMRIGDPGWNLVETFDPTQEHPREKLLPGISTVIHKPSISYREGGSNIRDAWCWKPNRIAHPNRWHVLEVEYPDDARRYFGVHAYSVNPLTGGITGGQMESMGILTGGFHLNAGKREKRRLMFRPEAEQIEIIVETGPFPRVFGSGSAVSMFRIYEATEDLLPALGAPGGRPLPGDRELGVWDEDPTMDCEWFARSMFDGDVNLELWNRRVERIVEYARFMGHTRWTVQVIDYDGDRNGNVLTLPSSTTRSHHGHVDGWVDLYAKVFEREKLPWYARMGQSTDGRYFRFLLGDAEAARLAQKPSGGAKDNLFVPDPALPESVEAICRAVREYRDKYADLPMFQGLSFESHRPLHYWDERYGYGDATVALFEKETGAKLPDLPLEKRYAYLMGEGKSKSEEGRSADLTASWIAWRCRKVEALNRAVVAELRKGNDRLQVKAYVFPNRMYRNSAEKDWNIDRELRKFGIDFAALNRIEGYEIAHFAMPDEEVTMSFRQEDNARIAACDHDPAVLGWIAAREKRPIANVMMHSNLETYQTAQLPECHFPLGYYGWDDSAKKNCNYLSWASCFTREDEALMPWCSLLANMDVQEIDIGFWGMPEMGAQELMREFYRAFRSIPKGRYKQVNDTKDPVAVLASGENWYMVNKESFKVKVKGQGQEWTVKPGEVKVMKGARPAAFVQTVDERDLRPFERAALNFRVKDATFKDAFDAALKEGDYGRARRIMYSPEGWNLLKSLRPFLARARWRAKDKTVEVAVTSVTPDSNPFDIRLESGCEAWGDSVTNRVVWISGGDTAVVNLKPSKWPAKDGEGGKVTVTVACHQGKAGYERFDFLLGGAFAYQDNAKRTVGDDWSFSRYKMVKHHVKDYDYSKTEQNFDYSLGYLWNETGLYVAVDVVEPEGQYRPPVKGQGFKLGPVQTDALQYFFATVGGAPYDQEGFDADNIECMYYDWSDGEHHGAIHRFAKGAPREQGKDALIYRDGHLKYEFFLPAEQFPHVAMARGTVIKAKCHIYNYFAQMSAQDDWHRMITNNPKSPYEHPGTWEDLIFVKEKPAK